LTAATAGAEAGAVAATGGCELGAVAEGLGLGGAAGVCSGAAALRPGATVAGGMAVVSEGAGKVAAGGVFALRAGGCSSAGAPGTSPLICSTWAGLRLAKALGFTSSIPTF